MVPNHLLMCAAHWSKVPATIQRRVYAAWNGGHPTADYEAARSQAITYARL